MEAEIKVLSVINSNTTKDGEARNHLIDGIESALKKRLDVTTIIVLGKSFHSQILNTFWWVIFYKKYSELTLQTVSCLNLG